LERVKGSKIPEAHKLKLTADFEKLLTGLIFIERRERGEYLYDDVKNLFLTEIFH